MKSTFTIALLLSVGLLIAGCSKNEPQSVPASKAPTALSGAVKDTKGSGAKALGSEVKSKGFVISLDLGPKPLKPGAATVKLSLTREGKPVDSAKIRIHFAMTSMHMGGPEVELISNGHGLYSAPVELGMAGMYEAHLTALAQGETATVAYSFEVAE